VGGVVVLRHEEDIVDDYADEGMREGTTNRIETV
jgi:hypothetical protein